jgi:hypothetical protein
MEYVLLAIGIGFFSGLSILIMVRAHQLKEMPRNTSAQVRAGFASFRDLAAIVDQSAGKP